MEALESRTLEIDSQPLQMNFVEPPPEGRGRPGGNKEKSQSRDPNGLSFKDRARCRGYDPELFFAPSRPEEEGEKLQRERVAKAICNLCSVRIECLTYALKTDEKFGIWGGLNERERRRLKEMAS